MQWRVAVQRNVEAETAQDAVKAMVDYLAAPNPEMVVADPHGLEIFVHAEPTEDELAAIAHFVRIGMLPG